MCVCVSVCVQTWQNRGFAKDMWLEAVNPHRPAEMCVAQITQVRGRLLWLRLEGTDACLCVWMCVWGGLSVMGLLLCSE